MIVVGRAAWRAGQRAEGPRRRTERAKSRPERGAKEEEGKNREGKGDGERDNTTEGKASQIDRFKANPKTESRRALKRADRKRRE